MTSIRPRRWSSAAATTPLDLTDARVAYARLLGVLGVLGVPGLLLVGGALVWAVRRRR